jgi:hypothetical protein
VLIFKAFLQRWIGLWFYEGPGIRRWKLGSNEALGIWMSLTVSPSLVATHRPEQLPLGMLVMKDMLAIHSYIAERKDLTSLSLN